MRTGADDDERHLRMPLGDNRFRDISSHVGLGPAGHQKLRHPGVHPVDRRACLAQRVDLRGVLDHPQSPQHVGGQHRHHTEQSGQRQQVQGRHRIGHRCGDAPHRPSASTTNRYGSSPSTQSRTASTEFGHRRILQRRQLQPRHHYCRITVGRQHQRRQPFEGLRTRSDQIPQVVTGCDDQPGKSCIRGGSRCGLKPVGIHIGAEAADGHGTEANRTQDHGAARRGARRTDCRRFEPLFDYEFGSGGDRRGVCRVGGRSLSLINQEHIDILDRFAEQLPGWVDGTTSTQAEEKLVEARVPRRSPSRSSQRRWHIYGNSAAVPNRTCRSTCGPRRAACSCSTKANGNSSMGCATHRHHLPQ